jgi:O6-methylguanine-DNA--protein-cysteine methyltransferase
LNELFRRWCGLTPKAFLQAVTLDNAKKLLAQSPNILETSYELGLSGPGRLHDLFVVHEAMSPGEWKTGGEGLEIRYGFHPSPFGTAIVMMTPRGLCGLAFSDPGKESASLKDMRERWKNASYVEDSAATADIAARIFQSDRWQPDTPLRVVLIGTDFEIRVWQTLLKVPLGRAATYSDVARKSEKRKPRGQSVRPLARIRSGSRQGRIDCIGIEPIDDRHAGQKLALDDAFRRVVLQHHDQRAQRIAVGCDQHVLLAAQHAGQDVLHIIGPDARAGVAQAFAARRRRCRRSGARYGPAPRPISCGRRPC